MATHEILVLGVMTGTSCDGLDASLASFRPDGEMRILSHQSYLYPPTLKKRVLQIQKPHSKVSLQHWLELDRDLGNWYGTVLNKIIQKSPRPHLIANHGQTIGHFPFAKPLGLTLQAGDPFVIAQTTKLTVVSDFRKGDLAAGGQGAPLLPLYHLKLLKKEGPGTAIHNLGGISNFTYLTPRKSILACDTGPGGLFIDAAAAQASQQPFDRDGALGRKGRPDLKGIYRMLEHPYFKKPLPKSTGRDDFDFEWFLKNTRTRGADLVATATWLTAFTIYLTYKAWILEEGWPLKKILFCGGGAKNRTLLAAVEWLFEAEKSPPKILPLQNAQWIESEAFAWFGYRSLLGQTLGGSWTGTRGFAPPGKIIPGANFGQILNRLVHHRK